MSDISIDLRATRLSRAEQDIVGRLAAALTDHQRANDLKHAYYDGTSRLRNLGISIPPELQWLEVVVGWPSTAVDVLEERLDLLGLETTGDYGIADVWTANELAAESSMGHLDSLIYGVSYIATGSGDTAAGEPEVLVTMESPRSMTVEWDTRSRTVAAAFAFGPIVDGEARTATLYLPAATIRLEKVRNEWAIRDRDDHKLGVVTVGRLVNRPWGGNRQGRSEITKAIRYLTDAAARTLLGAEVAREFFSAPQRWVMGADEESFVDTDGNAIPAWESYLGRILALSADENGVLPSVGQFSASSPEPFWASMRGYATLFAAEAGLPTSYLGISTDQPPSADSVRALEARLLKRAERRQIQYGAGWRAAAGHILMVRDGSAVLPDGFEAACLWRDPATPTKAAAADAASKMVASGILPADSSVTWELVGLSPDQQKRLKVDLARRQAMAFADAVTAGVNGAVGS